MATDPAPRRRCLIHSPKSAALGWRWSLLAAVATLWVAVPIAAQVHGTPGKDGPGGTLTGIVNTYYPGSGTAAAGATTLTLGAASGAAVPIAPGDLLLVIQMQDADINLTNTTAYGANNGTGAGATALNSSGRYEYVTALSTVGLGGGTVTIRGTGSGNGLVNTYRSAAATATSGQRRYQVVRVPQYSTATTSSGLTASYWNGTTGGILVLDVAGVLTLGGTVSVDGRGFRGAPGRALAGGSGGSNTDFLNLASNAFHGGKGEGIAGTPRFVLDPATGLQLDTGVEGYPNGSTARGAPGNAGGGGTDGRPAANDENSGGGGGSNGGAGGAGGNSWNSQLAVGGRGGAALAASATRLALGGGAGAGSRNNSSGVLGFGGAGGGMVLLRAASVSGTGTISANGLAGSTPLNDGGGGGGAGGSILVYAATGTLAGLTARAAGGNGGNADVGGVAHGPGGGGGGGVIVLSSSATTDVTAGAPGYTVSPGNLFGAVAGSTGLVLVGIPAGTIPGTVAGADAVPVLSVTKTTSTPSVANTPSGTQATYTILVAATPGRDTARSVTISDVLPAGFTFFSSPGPVLAGGASRPSVANPTVGAAVPSWGVFAIPGGGSVTITFTVSVAAGVVAGVYQNPATAAYLDPARTVPGGTTTANYVATSSTGEDVTVVTVGVTVIPDGAQLLQRLPSNGVTYSATFTVNNTGSSSGSFGIKAFRRPGSAVTILSVNGVAGDSVTATIAAGAALALPVVYSIGNVAGGVVDSLYLRARSTVNAAVSDTGFADLTVVRPAMTTTKVVVASGPTVPGSELSYQVTIANIGAATASGAVLVDSLPSQVDFKLGSGVATLPAGVTVVVAYSRDAGATWTYVPVSAGCGAPAGFDRCVNRTRWTFAGGLAVAPPNNSAILQFVTRIR